MRKIKRLLEIIRKARAKKMKGKKTGPDLLPEPGSTSIPTNRRISPTLRKADDGVLVAPDFQRTAKKIDNKTARSFKTIDIDDAVILDKKKNSKLKAMGKTAAAIGGSALLFEGVGYLAEKLISSIGNDESSNDNSQMKSEEIARALGDFIDGVTGRIDYSDILSQGKVDLATNHVYSMLIQKLVKGSLELDHSVDYPLSILLQSRDASIVLATFVANVIDSIKFILADSKYRDLLTIFAISRLLDESTSPGFSNGLYDLLDREQDSATINSLSSDRLSDLRSFYNEYCLDQARAVFERGTKVFEIEESALDFYDRITSEENRHYDINLKIMQNADIDASSSVLRWYEKFLVDADGDDDETAFLKYMLNVRSLSPEFVSLILKSRR